MPSPRLARAAALTAAFSAIAYELLLASYATFLLGASIFQYSLVFSLMMASMGAGAWAAERLRTPVARTLIALELAIAVLALVAVPTLYFVFAAQGPAQLLLFAFVLLMGAGLGMEVPLLNRLEKDGGWLNDILFSDYLGGFAGGMLFPFFLFPHLGFFRLAGVLAAVNAGVALLFAARARPRSVPAWLGATVVLVVCLGYCLASEKIRVAMETSLFGIAP